MPQTGIVVLGARGSIPVSGPEFAKYGGNSTCFAIVVNGLTVGFIDAGSGMAAYRQHGLHLAPRVDIFLTHYHWDHIQGLSMFDEIWQGGCDIVLHGPGDPKSVLEAAISPPVFPVPIAEAETIRYDTSGEAVNLHGLTISSFPVHHPQGGIGYRIDGPERSVAIVTDHEAGFDVDDIIVAAVDGVDTLFHDSQYRPSEMEIRAGWGHSTLEDSIQIAERIGASQLILTSHDPGRTDTEIDELVRRSSERVPNTIGASEGLEVAL